MKAHLKKRIDILDDMIGVTGMLLQMPSNEVEQAVLKEREKCLSLYVKDLKLMMQVLEIWKQQ